MDIVLPKVVDVATQEAGIWDTRLGSEDGQRLLVEQGVTRIGFQPRGGAPVLRLDPGQSLR